MTRFFRSLGDRDSRLGWLRANTTGGKRIRAGLPKSWIIGDKTSIPWSGGGGIRTLGRGVTPTTVFETARFNHSRTPPRGPETVANPRTLP